MPKKPIIKKTNKSTSRANGANRENKKNKSNIIGGKQTAGADANICKTDINQLLMGNPPVSIGGIDPSKSLRDTQRTAKDLEKYGKTGWGNYPGTPPKPDCVIL